MTRQLVRKRLCVVAFSIVSIFIFTVSETSGDESQPKNWTRQGQTPSFRINSSSAGTDLPDYSYDSTTDTTVPTGATADSQYEKIIIRKILREQEAETGPEEIIAQQPEQSRALFTIYGFSIIPETAVSTMILIGGLIILRRRRRG